MRARPKPLLGAVLGLMLALVSVALVTALGVLPADRTLVWGAGAVGLLLGALLLTQRPSTARRRLLAVAVIGGLSAGIAVTGIPELSEGGTLTDGCTLTATSSLEREPVAPTDTTGAEPFDVKADDWVAWEASSASVLTDWRTAVGVRVGGFDVMWWEGGYENPHAVTELSGTELVKPRTQAFHDRFGVPFSGVYHVVATLDTDAGACAVDLYLRVSPATPVSGWLLLGLWAAGAALVLTLLVLAWDVRGSLKDADADAAAAREPREKEAAPSAVWPELDEGD